MGVGWGEGGGSINACVCVWGGGGINVCVCVWGGGGGGPACFK